MLTEDGTKHNWPYAYATVRELTKKLFRHLDDRCETHRIGFSTLEDEQLRELVAANNFRSRRHPERYRLYQRLAAELRAEGFIVHHVDADRAWEPPPRESANEAAVSTHIVERVRRLFSENNIPGDEIEAMLRRYLLLVPYREIEAWLYQNTDRAIALCRADPRCRGQHVPLLESWRTDRGALDEHPDPPAALCLGKAHNSELVQAYPTADVVAGGKSLAAAVAAMLACDALLHAIQRTYETPPGPQESV